MKHFCLICGMEINDNNMDVNKHAFIYENMDDKAIFCPFCGATHEYLVNEGKFKIYKIKDKLNIETNKILDHAVKLELFNSDFYKKASNLAKKDELRKMFIDLSRIEKMHAMIHYNLGGFNELPKLTDINYDKYKNDNLLIEQALLREKHAVQFYNKYIPSIENKAVREILIALREVEKAHIELLN